MKTIDLTNKFEGHVVLWAKHHYGERTLERLYEMQREWSGMTDKWTPFPKDVLLLIREAADLLGINGRQVVESVTYKFWMDNDKMTTYHVGMKDSITLESLIMAYANAIESARVRGEDLEVKLPNLLHDMKYKYELERA
jgi:hypothetical protein